MYIIEISYIIFYSLPCILRMYIFNMCFNLCHYNKFSFYKFAARLPKAKRCVFCYVMHSAL